jgi:hypothetical protein
VLTILWTLPLLVLTSPLAVLARDTTSILPINLGQAYTGSLTPSPSNPHGEVCYKLALNPNTRITLNVKTSGIGIIKFAVYDKARSLRFFHNHVNNKPQSAGDALTDSKFSFPAIGDASQLCLTTSNSNRTQKYDLTVSGKPQRKAKSRLKLRSVAVIPPTAPRSKPLADIPTVTQQIPPPVTPQVPTTVEPQRQARNEPFCYVGTWQIIDLSAYWLPTIQNLTQAEIGDRQMLGYAKVTMTKDGYAQFEAIDLEQQYTLKSKETGTKIDKLGLNLAGNTKAKFQTNPDDTITFNSQDYRRLTTKLNLGSSLQLTGDRLFTFFGDKDIQPSKLPYSCLDRDNMILKVPLPTGQKLVPISLKRIG